MGVAMGVTDIGTEPERKLAMSGHMGCMQDLVMCVVMGATDIGTEAMRKLTMPGQGRTNVGVEAMTKGTTEQDSS